MAARVVNVSAHGAARRKRNGGISLAIAVAVAVALVAFDPPRFYRLILGIPIGLAALNLLQAREKT